jgi:nitrite reductase/ring-hydroxylating ferredoxin subunit
MAQEIRVCESPALQEAGMGYRFKVLYNGEPVSAFLVRVEGVVRGFLNRCSHVPVELDWNYGEFLDDTGRQVVCATHGASYNAESGRCVGGPCSGSPLVRLQVEEKNGGVFWLPSQHVTIPPDGIED